MRPFGKPRNKGIVARLVHGAGIEWPAARSTTPPFPKSTRRLRSPPLNAAPFAHRDRNPISQSSRSFRMTDRPRLRVLSTVDFPERIMAPFERAFDVVPGTPQ
jgi:hypothetical protein